MKNCKTHGKLDGHQWTWHKAFGGVRWTLASCPMNTGGHGIAVSSGHRWTTLVSHSVAANVITSRHRRTSGRLIAKRLALARVRSRASARLSLPVTR